MSLSLKKDKMIEYLEDAKVHDEEFECMLWGTVNAKFTSFTNRSAASMAMAFTHAPGVAGSLNNAFCYIGMTGQSLYVIALDSYNTSRITGTFSIPFTSIASLKVRKGIFGITHTVEVESDEFVRLTVKGVSLGTDIKDQKDRMKVFLSKTKALIDSLGG